MGLRTAVLNITSDATPSDIRVELSGIGSEAVSVEESATKNDIIITPNPTNDFIEIISYNSLAAENISVFNALGEPAIKNTSGIINQNDGANKAYRIDVSMLPAGIYFIRINNDIRKFIKL